jgi:hypothetical protein
MIWDFCPDMMHINKTFWERLAVGVFSGARCPPFTAKKPAEPTPSASAEAQTKYRAALAKYESIKADYSREARAFQECTFSEADRKLVDERVKNLVGYPDWIKTTLVRVMLGYPRFLSC